MDLDRFSVNQRHILDEETENTFSFPRFDRWIIPYSWEVAGERQKLLASLGIDQKALFLCLLFVLRLRFGQDAELVVPLRFQAVSHKPVRGVHIHVTSPREFSFVLCPLDMLPPQRIGLGDPRFDFLLNRNGNFQGHGLHQFEQQSTDRLIDNRTRHALTDLFCVSDGCFLADVGWGHLVIGDVVMYAHAFSADAAEDAALQKRRPLACRTSLTCATESECVFGQSLLIRFKLFPGDVAGMGPRNQKLPLGSWNLLGAVFAIR